MLKSKETPLLPCAGYAQAVIPSFSLPVRSQCASRQSDRLPKLNMQTSVLRTIFIVSVLYVAWGCGEVQTNRYETVQDARQDRLFERGWVPDVLPDSTIDIVEAHDIDTNQRCARARFPVSARPSLISSLAAAGFHEVDEHPTATPFRPCTFERPDLARTDAAFRREMAQATIRGEEFVVLAGDIFYYWSARLDER